MALEQSLGEHTICFFFFLFTKLRVIWSLISMALFCDRENWSLSRHVEVDWTPFSAPTRRTLRRTRHSRVLPTQALRTLLPFPGDDLAQSVVFSGESWEEEASGSIPNVGRGRNVGACPEEAEMSRFLRGCRGCSRICGFGNGPSPVISTNLLYEVIANLRVNVGSCMNC